MRFSSFIERFGSSATLKMTQLARQLKAEGHDVIDLSIGEPDFNTPDYIKQAAIDAIHNNYSHYPPISGYPLLKEAIVYKLKRDNHLLYKTENIMVSTGAKQSIANLILALVDQGDEVIIPTPYWVSYADIVKMAGGTPIFIQTTIAQHYKLQEEDLEKAITHKTKMFIFSSPNNPAGIVYKQSELKALADIFAKNPHIAIVSDEIYEYINYKGKHESIAQFDHIKDRVIIINGVSKNYAMTGWRIGYMVANIAIIKACEKIQTQMTSGANSIAQMAAATAIHSNPSASMEMTKAFHKRRDYMVNFFQQLKGMQYIIPEGAFYLFPDCSRYFGTRFSSTEYVHIINNADDLAMYLLQYHFVGSVSGNAFGHPNNIRFSFARSLDKIKIACQRIQHALNQLHSISPSI